MTATMSPIDSSLAQEPSLPPLNSSNGVSSTTTTKPTSRATISLDTYDEEQVRLMEERCILVTPQDEAYGEACKKTCHLMANIRGPESLLHRAFSVFLFRPSDGRLLLQKRAAEKITFPNMWTNTCCSHPLSTASEREEQHQMGVRRAACRKLPHELGTKESELTPADFTYLTRIHYLAPCEVDEKTGEEGIWGEHEIDYILFATKDVTLDLNLNEVSDATYVNEQELRAMFDDSINAFTPWFKLICRDLLFPWWSLMLTRSRQAGWQYDEQQDKCISGHVSASVLESEVKDVVMKLV
jgi:isopentenyl-diphosphate delta-isomerase